MLFPLVLILSVMSLQNLIASDMNLKTVVEQAERAAHAQKKEVEAMTATIKGAIEQTALTKDASCSVGGCAAFKGAPQQSQKNSPLMDTKQPLLFVSASMPIASLKKLAYQATKHNALLVIRGMVRGSMVETAKLVDEIDHPLDIDPKLFERFEIIKVPVFMVYHNQGWHKVSGNVDLNFAIETATQQKLPSPLRKEDQS